MIFWLAVTIFVVTFFGIVSDKVHETNISAIGALLMILLGIINQHQAIQGVDFNTLGLLIGMMVLVGISKQSGMYQYIAVKAAQLAKGKPMGILVFFGLLTAIFSALLDNVTTALLLVPMVFVIANHLKVSAKPYLLTTILLSNIGGAATLIGDPPNILIGGAANLSFNDFLWHLGPVIAIITAVTLAISVYLYKKELVTTHAHTIMELDAKKAISDPTLLVQSLVVFGLVFLGFMTHAITHLEGATVALGGAAILLLITRKNPEHFLRDVEWNTIFFFVALFILVTGLEQAGVIGAIASGIISLTDGNAALTQVAILWGSAIASAMVNNIPFVAAMIPVIEQVGATTGMAVQPLWWSLALGTDLGGNATLIGASANMVVCCMAERDGYKIKFFDYMKVALPMTALSLVISMIYVLVRY